MAVANEAPGKSLQGLPLQSRQDHAEDGPHDFVPVALQPAQKAVEREVLFWYPVGDGDLDFEVVHWATSPIEDWCSLGGCSLFFSPMSNAIT